MGATQMMVQEDNNELNALLADLNLAEAPDELVLEVEPEMMVVSLEIANALTAIDAIENDEGAPPVAPTVEVIVKPAKVAKVAKVKAEAKVKEASVARVHYANKVERISANLGDKLGDFTVLELVDAMLTGDALKAKQQATLDIVQASGVKVQNRQTFILEFIAGKSAKLNGVIQSALTILSKDGFIKMGVDGNFHKELLAKPYSVNAAKAMGGNTVLALKTLKVVIEDAGKLVANPNSLILMKLKAMGVAS